MGLLCQRKIYRMSHYRLFSVGVLFLLSVVSVPHVWAQQTLENPQPDSFQSGIGIISGWACNARRIEIAFNGGAPQAAAYGTSRGDTRQVCGDTDNGFGLLYNWNLLGDGVHTVVAYADGVEFASTTVIVTTLGEAFLRGVSDSYTISDFPDPGATRTLRWQEAQQNFVISAGSSQGGGTSGRPPRVLENPPPGSYQSGIGIISGWVCDAQRVELTFDGGSPQEAAYGTPRGDTRQVCGDTDNGFGLLYNWNLLGAGSHHVVAYADGVEFARVDVTVTTLGAEFRRGLSREVALPDFPEVGTDTVLTWQEAQQNFVIASAATTSRLVGVTPTLKLPAGVSIPNVEISSLYADGAEVSASPEPSLLLAVDTDGTVLLAIADQDGGLLGEAQGTVEVSVDSTAVTLIGLIAGIAVSDMTLSVVDAVRTHAQYPSLVAAMSTQLAADKNFLDRLYAFPDIVNTIRQVAASLPGTLASNRHASGQPRRLASTSTEPHPHRILATILYAWTAKPRHAHAQESGASELDCAHKRTQTTEKVMLTALDQIFPVKDAIEARKAIKDTPSIAEAFANCARRKTHLWKARMTGHEPPPLPELDKITVPANFGDGLLLHGEAVKWQNRVTLECKQEIPRELRPAMEKTGKFFKNVVMGKVLKAIKAGGGALSWLGTIIEGWLKKEEYDEVKEELEALEREGCTCQVNAAGECVEDEEDVNAPPEFEEASYTFTLLENRDGTRGGGVYVGTVQAHDPDRQHPITYRRVAGGLGKMHVNPGTGEVRYTGDGADYEVRLIVPLHITVRATESGGDGLSTDVRVTVEIKDVDEPPYFRGGVKRYEFTKKVTHSSLVGNVPIGTVQAEDPEKTTVHYSLVRGDSRFGVSSGGRVTYCCYNDPLPGGEATHRLIVRATDSGAAGLSTDIQVNVRLVGDDDPYQLIYCRRDRDVEIEGPDAGWAGRSSWHCIDTELKHERPELFTPYRVCNEYNRTHAWLRGPDAMLMEVIGEYQYLAQCVEDIPVEVSCIGSHKGFCGYWGNWD